MSQHSLPVFEGRWSRRHAPVTIESLVQRADADLASYGTPTPRAYVQFAGFPRSGHSLVGAILGMHRQAVMAHELDVTGLVKAGLGCAQLLALTRLNAAEFAASGHWWNGFCYAGRPSESTHAFEGLLFGDKKGDSFLRRFARSPEVLRILSEQFEGLRLPWIVVVRNPYDNVATMSLRKGRHYDRLRIRSDSTDIASHAHEKIPRAVVPEVVEDYTLLCEALASFRASRYGNDMLIIRHESLMGNPSQEIRRLFGFLELPVYKELLEVSCNLVNRQPHHSRFEIDWPAPLRRRVAELIERYDVFSNYDWAS